MNEPVKTNVTPTLTPDELRESEIGVVGIGTIGASIVACLLVAGHRVRAIEPVAASIPVAKERTIRYLDSVDAKYRPQSNEEILERLTISDEYADLKSCAVVIETVLEKLEVKHDMIRHIEAHVGTEVLISTNTSALPVTQIQRVAQRPGRVLGLHWGHAPMMPFLEIIKGDLTTDDTMARIQEYARFWGKDPTIVRKDIRGFVANRLGHAMYREALYLYTTGVASAADIDRAAHYAFGAWAAYEGPFTPLEENFDLILATMRDLYPDLCNSGEVPPFLEEMFRSGRRDFYDRKAELNREAERRHLEGIAPRTARALAELEAMDDD